MIDDQMSVFGTMCYLKVALLSAPVSSELPFCKTTLLRKKVISPIIFGLSKSGKKDAALHYLRNPKICDGKVSVKAGFANYFQTFC